MGAKSTTTSNHPSTPIHIELNNLEQYSRKTCIRIQGLNIPQSTDTTDAVLSTIKEHLNLTLTKHDIESCS